MSSRRRGFTFVEMLIVMIVLGILASLAVMKYIDLRHRALTAQATADLESVRLAAYSAWYETGAWPDEEPAGVVPTGLAPYLIKNFSFSKSEYSFDWENLVPPGGGTSGGMQLGVTVLANSESLRRSLIQTLGSKAPFFVVGGNVTFVIIGPDGKF
ncbi:MAG TPA: prepilin-type N-terminal cleavage/methylation domain-containing protein [Gemmatimonadales bacterium]